MTNRLLIDLSTFDAKFCRCDLRTFCWYWKAESADSLGFKMYALLSLLELQLLSNLSQTCLNFSSIAWSALNWNWNLASFSKASLWRESSNLVGAGASAAWQWWDPVSPLCQDTSSTSTSKLPFTSHALLTSQDLFSLSFFEQAHLCVPICQDHICLVFS